MHIRPVRVHIAGRVRRAPANVRGVFDLTVQAQTVPPLGAVGAEVAGERPLPGVHTNVLHQFVGCPRQVAAPVAPILVALAMTLEVNQQLLLLWKRPLADAAAMLRGALLRLGCHGNCRSAAGGGSGSSGDVRRASGSQKGREGLKHTHLKRLNIPMKSEVKNTHSIHSRIKRQPCNICPQLLHLLV